MKNVSLNPDCTLLVSSCDRYEDLWEPYFSLLRAHWPDCPFPVMLITESKCPVIENVRPLCLGEGLDWSTLLSRALDQVETPFVLFTLEDFFLREQVNTTLLTSLLDDVKLGGFSMLRLIPRPGPTVILNQKNYGGIQSDAPYKVSTQAAFWEVQTLRQLLVPGEAAWQFEVNASARSSDLSGFFAVWRDALPYRHHVVERGKWFPWAYRKFSKMNIGVDGTARPIMTVSETVVWVIRKLLPPIIRYFPKKCTLKI